MKKLGRDIWQEVLEVLPDRLGMRTAGYSLTGMTADGLRDETLTVAVFSPAIAKRLECRYGARISRALEELRGVPVTLRIVVMEPGEIETGDAAVIRLAGHVQPLHKVWFGGPAADRYGD